MWKLLVRQWRRYFIGKSIILCRLQVQLSRCFSFENTGRWELKKSFIKINNGFGPIFLQKTFIWQYRVFRKNGFFSQEMSVFYDSPTPALSCYWLLKKNGKPIGVAVCCTHFFGNFERLLQRWRGLGCSGLWKKNLSWTPCSIRR